MNGVWFDVVQTGFFIIDKKIIRPQIFKLLKKSAISATLVDYQFVTGGRWVADVADFGGLVHCLVGGRLHHGILTTARWSARDQVLVRTIPQSGTQSTKLWYCFRYDDIKRTLSDDIKPPGQSPRAL